MSFEAGNAAGSATRHSFQHASPVRPDVAETWHRTFTKQTI